MLFRETCILFGMTDTALAPAKVEVPQPVESNIEAPKQGMESGMESGDASGVFRRAQADVDKTLASELAISKIDDPKAAAVAEAEVIKLKQADAEFQSKAEGALGNLKQAIGAQIIESPISNVESPVMAPVSAPEIVETKQIETVLGLPAEKQARLDTVNEELKHEETALHEFENTHTKAVTKLEEAYLNALKARVDALKFEQGAISGGREDQQAISDHRMKADQAEAVYSKMYEEYLEQPEDEEIHEADAPITTEEVPAVFEAPTQRHFQANPHEVISMPEQPKPPGRAGQAVGKFVDGLKFWKYFTRR